jgi:hypothetical protein
MEIFLTVDKYLGLGVLTIPVLVLVLFMMLKWTFKEAIKIAVIVFLVLLFLKYPVINILHKFI